MIMEQIKQKILDDGIVAIVRGDFGLDQLVSYAETVLKNGLTVLEVTLNSSGALQAISLLRERFGDQMVIGAGTVRNTAQFLDAIAAGAQFTVAPGSEKGTMEAARNEGILHVPGVFTATEVEQAYGIGYRLLKLFPAAELGPSYLKSLRAPLNDVSFIPTGGVDASNITAYRRAGAVGVGVGSSLIKAGISNEELAERASALRAGWDAGA